MAHDVFISYAAEDKTIADAASAVLEQQNVRCWIAPRDVPAGDEYASAIVDAIREAKVLVLVFSSHANDSPHVRREVERAVSSGIAILPLRIEDVLPSPSLEYYISDSHWLDALTPPVEAHLQNLAETTAYLVERAGTPVRSDRGPDAKPRRRLPVVLALAGAAVLVVAAAVIVALALTGDDSGPPSEPGPAVGDPDNPMSWYTTDGSLPELMPDCNGVFGLCLGTPIEQAEALFGIADNKFEGPDGLVQAWNVGPIKLSVESNDVGSIISITASITEGDQVALGLPQGLTLGESTMGDARERFGTPTDTDVVNGEGLVIYEYIYVAGAEGVQRLVFDYGTRSEGTGGTTDPGGFNRELAASPITGFTAEYENPPTKGARSYARPVAYDTRLLPGPFGALEVLGLQLPDDATDPTSGERLRDALWKHGVVCIRLAAPLTDTEARALASMIGPVKDPVGRARDGTPLRYGEDRQIIDAGFVLTDELREELGDVSFGGDRLRPGLFEQFHTDDSFVSEPATATMLHARALPSRPGGDTRFIDMRAAFRMLDPLMQDRLIGLHADYSYNNQGAFPPRVPAQGPLEQLVDVTHPVVRAHPVTDEAALYFDLDRATGIAEMDDGPGRALLQSLQDHAEARAPRYAHRLHNHDVLIWDNASVQHCASGDFPVGEPRRFWRYMIEGTRPVAA